MTPWEVSSANRGVWGDLAGQAVSERTANDGTLPRPDQYLRIQLRPDRMGDLRRTDPVHRTEHRALLASGHHVRWQRPDDLRPAGPAGPRAGPSGSGSGTERVHAW